QQVAEGIVFFVNQGLGHCPTASQSSCPVTCGRAAHATPRRAVRSDRSAGASSHEVNRPVQSASCTPPDSRDQFTCHVCATVLLQLHNCTCVPSSAWAPLTSRHLLLLVFTKRTSPPPTSCWTNDCAPVPLQSYSCALVPSAVPELAMST